MTCKDQVFIIDVVIIDLTWEIVALNVINQTIGAIVEFNAIAKIYKYKRFYEAHHFISMAMEMHYHNLSFGFT